MNGPLAGLRVVNTRAVHQAADLDRALIAAGAVPLSFPCIAIAPSASDTGIDAALIALAAGEFDWLILTSVNTVAALSGRLVVPTRCPRVAAIGPVTAHSAGDTLGLDVAFVPDVNTALALAHTIPIDPGDRVLIPVSEIADSVLERNLELRGAVVTRVVAYTTVTGSGGVDLRSLLVHQQVDALIFASPSAVAGLLARFDADGGSSWDRFDLPTVCIGNSTAESAIKRGFTSVIAASTQSVEGLVAALRSAGTSHVNGVRR